jgi:leucyl aminopeptidase
MSLNILKSFESGAQDSVCVLVPCITVEDAKIALVQLGTSGDPEPFIRDFDPACEEAGNIYDNGRRIIFIGLAKSTSYSKLRQALQLLSGKLKKKQYQKHILLLSHVQDSARVTQLADAAVNGWILGRYDFGLLKSQNGQQANEGEVSLDIVAGTHDVAQAVQLAEESAASQMAMFNLVNLPSSHKTPESLAEWTRQSGKSQNYKVEVLGEKELKAQGFEAILAVNRGSELPARLIITQYDGTGDGSGPLIALVGKGVTFDTGGVSLKSGDSMHLMKSDMGGAAAVLGAVDLIARMKAPVRVIGCAPCTDNSIGTLAIKPGDVIGSYSGKTIEVINTDAEGRLILADALNYIIKTHNPDVVLDLATLTGSVIRALGNQCAGFFTHSDVLARQLAEAGDQSGERLWRLPLWDEYGEEMKSEIADVKNLSDKSAAGSITAAKFIEFFVEDHKAWAHLDIAGVAFKANGVSKSHAATGFGVRLLYEFVTRYPKG